MKKAAGMRYPQPLLALIALLLGCCSDAVARPGDLDTTFGSGGIVVTAFPGNNAGLTGVAVQGNGAIVVTGYVGDTSSGLAAVARYMPNGVLDPSFGNAGVTTSGPPGTRYQAVALQTDGKIVTVGSNAALRAIIVARYLVNGQPDPGFGVAGRQVVTDPVYALGGGAIAVQTDGKIVVGGSANLGGTGSMLLARLNADGSLDASFGSSGLSRLAVAPSVSTYVSALAIQANGQIVIAGAANSAAWTVARVNTDGSLDTTFGTSGVATAPAPLGSFGGGIARGVALRADGSLVTAGYSSSGDVNAVQFSGTGQVDPLFGSGGIATASLNPIDYGFALCLRPDGSAMVAGSTSSANFDVMLSRFDSRGQLDTGFASGGIARTSVLGDEEAAAIACAGNAVVVAGYTRAANGSSDFLLLRYDAAGQPQAVPTTTPLTLALTMLALLAATAVLSRRRTSRRLH